MSMFSKAGFVACTVLLAAGTAQAGERYVLTASTWGKLQAANVAAAGGKVRFAHSGAGVAVVESSNPQFLSQVLASGAIKSGALDVEVDWTGPMRTFDLEANAVNPGDDRYFNTIQWAPQAVKAPQAWAAGFDGEGVRVAVIDGGIFDAHPDLGANVDRVAARSFVAPVGDPVTDPCRIAWNCDTGTLWHGTHVAGIIAAVDNSIGVVGIAPKATIVPVKALHSGSGSFGAVIQAILYAASAGNADIINMSLGAVFPRNEGNAALTSALNRAVNTAGRLGCWWFPLPATTRSTSTTSGTTSSRRPRAATASPCLRRVRWALPMAQPTSRASPATRTGARRWSRSQRQAVISPMKARSCARCRRRRRR